MNIRVKVNERMWEAALIRKLSLHVTWKNLL